MAANKYPPGDAADAANVAKLLLEKRRREDVCYRFCNRVPLSFMNSPAADGVRTPLLDQLTRSYILVRELLEYVPEHYDRRQEAENFLGELAEIRPYVRW